MAKISPSISDEEKSISPHPFTLTEKEEYEEEKSMEKKQPHEEEKPLAILLSITIPFFIAGFGMVAAGVLLDYSQLSELFINVQEVVILVPSLLGLKGNLEMTLASRLSTQVNIGKIHDHKTTVSAVFGNSILIQLQSIIVGFLAAFLAALLEFINMNTFNPSHFLILITTSVATASFASLLLASIVMFIIIVSSKFNVNPDNVATPIASSLGDLVTLAILLGVGTFFYIYKTYFAIPLVIIIVYVLLIPIFGFICHRNEFVKETLYQGWIPIISAMLISSVAGIGLRISIMSFPIVAVFQPVINGVGGNLVAIFASRLSTSIQRSTEKGNYPTWSPKSYLRYPYETFFGKLNPERRTAQILVLLIIPGHLVFFFTIFFIHTAENNDVYLTIWLVVFYLIIAFIQVILLFLICYWLVMFVWRLKKNPDNSCIPYLTSLGDLLGVSFLLLCMYLVYLTGNDSVRQSSTEAPIQALMNTTTPYYNSTVSL